MRATALQMPERNQRLVNTYEGPQMPGKATLEVILHPVSDLQFNHFGGDRVHGEVDD